MFKVGDVVKCIHGDPSEGLRMNGIYIVKGLQDGDDYFIWVSDLEGALIGKSGRNFREHGAYHFTRSRFIHDTSSLPDSCLVCSSTCKADKKCELFRRE